MTAMQNSQTSRGAVAATISVATLLVGATTVFAALEAALQQIWGARKLAPSGIRGWVRSRLLSLWLWLYYSAQIFLFGAEFTACLGGSRVQARSSP